MLEQFFLDLPDLNTVGIWASIIGVPIGIGAIIIAIAIFKNTRRIETQQRKNAEGLYVDKTTDNLKKIQNYFDDIFRIVEAHNIENEDERDLASSELNLHYRKHHSDMTKLLQRSERDLELWISLEHVKRDKFDKIITNFDWLTSKFFPLTAIDDEMRTKIWTTEYKTFLGKKYTIDDILKEELKTTA